MSTIPDVPTRINPELIANLQDRGAHEPRIAAGNADDAPQDGPAVSIAGTPLIMELQEQVQHDNPRGTAKLKNTSNNSASKSAPRAVRRSSICDISSIGLTANAGRSWASLPAWKRAIRSGTRNSAKPGDLFVAVLNAMVGDEDVARCGRGCSGRGRGCRHYPLSTAGAAGSMWTDCPTAGGP